MKYKISVVAIYFLILYILAFISARDIREDDAILGVNRSQWKALFLLWLPSFVVFGK
jgi:hypothetical protein